MRELDLHQPRLQVPQIETATSIRHCTSACRAQYRDLYVCNPTVSALLCDPTEDAPRSRRVVGRVTVQQNQEIFAPGNRKFAQTDAIVSDPLCRYAMSPTRETTEVDPTQLVRDHPNSEFG